MIRLYLQRIEVVILNTVNHIKRESGAMIKFKNPELFPQL